MIYKIETKSGKTIEARAFIEDANEFSIYIFSNALSHLEAYQFFSDKEDVTELKVIMEEEGKDSIFTIYKHYTELYGIRKCPIDGDRTVLQIWLKKEYPEDW